MIESLTTEQEAQLEVYKNKWLDIGLSVKRVDVEKSMEAIQLVYKSGNFTAPSKYEVYDSPYATKKAMKSKYNINISSHDFIYGAQDATWLSFYNYFLEVLDIKECEQLRGLMNLAEHSGWVLLFDDLVVFTHNPIHLKFDDENRSHCADGLAIEYSDGEGLAIWHGTVIPKEWIFDKSTITPDVMFKHPNIEQRRCACEIIEWAQVLKHLDAQVIDKDPDETIGTLLEVSLPDSGQEKFLLALDPNVNKLVGIPVPFEMKTALQANSWTYGIEEFDFKPTFRV